MTPGAAVAFGRYLERAQLDRPVLLDAEIAARCVRPYAWLLRRAGSDGLKLTTAGKLPPALVREAAEAFDWKPVWGSFSREDQLPPATALREGATRTGLVRKSHGRLLVTAAARGLADEPVRLLRHLAGRWLGGRRREVERDAAILLATELAVGSSPARSGALDGVAYGLATLGWRDQTGYQSPSTTQVWFLLGDDWNMLVNLGLVPDPFAEQEPVSPSAARDFARLALQEAVA